MLVRSITPMAGYVNDKSYRLGSVNGSRERRWVLSAGLLDDGAIAQCQQAEAVGTQLKGESSDATGTSIGSRHPNTGLRSRSR